jgi:hypothetical protein
MKHILVIFYIVYFVLFEGSRFLFVLPGISELCIKGISEPHDMLRFVKLRITLVETFQLKDYTKLLFCSVVSIFDINSNLLLFFACSFTTTFTDTPVKI